MRSILSIPIFLFILFSSFTQVALAQDFFVFPRQGQSNEQLQRDKVECQIWARQQTGFDPLQTPTASAPPGGLRIARRRRGHRRRYRGRGRSCGGGYRW